MKPPLITIAINNYNYGRFVVDAIESALSQTYKNVEVICVDDGSTDNSRRIISDYKNIKSIFQINGGQSSAARRGLATAEGEIIVFLDSDDRLRPDACQTIADIWTPDTVSVQFALETFSNHSKTSRVMPAKPFVENHLDFFITKGRYPYSPTSGNAFRTEVAKTIFKVADIPDRLFFDACLVFSSPFFGKIQTVGRPLADYRIHEDNISSTGGKHFTLLHDRFLDEAIRRIAEHTGHKLDPDFDFLGPQYWNKILKLYMINPSTITLEEARKAARRLQALSIEPRGQPLRSRVANFLAATAFTLHPNYSAKLYRKALRCGMHRDFS